jgi:predicted ribosomally synthesized peptide with SipW-like signal peptide
MKLGVASAIVILISVAARAEQTQPPDLNPQQRAVGQIAMAFGLAIACDKAIDQAAVDSYIADKLGDAKFSGKEMVAAALGAVGTYAAFSKNSNVSGPLNPKAVACGIAMGAYGPDGTVIKGIIRP